MEYRDLCNLAQLSVTAFLICSYPMLILVWGKMAKEILATKTEYKWLVFGALTFFIGHFGDISYWAFPWSADFIKHVFKDTLFANGLYFNLAFRQGMGMVSVLCHYKAAMMTTDSVTKRFLVCSICVSVFMMFTFPLILLFLRG